MPKYSIIVPVYNVENCLPKCLDSILRQSYIDFEVLLIDDGSKDCSGQICDQYVLTDSRVKVIHTSNRGVSSARNRGIEEARGKYIVFVDSDDYIDIDYLADLDSGNEDLIISGLRKLESRNNNAQIVQYSEKVIENVEKMHVEDMVDNKALNYVYTKRFRYDLIEYYSLRFDEQLNIGEDTLFVAEYLLHVETIRYTSGVFYNYYQNTDNSLSSFKEDYVGKLMTANDKIQNVLEHRFSNLGETESWNKRCWSVFYYSIFYILKNWNVTGKQKKRALKKIFSLDKFKSYSRQLDIYMVQDPPIIKKIIKSGNATLVYLTWKILSRP